MSHRGIAICCAVTLAALTFGADRGFAQTLVGAAGLGIGTGTASSSSSSAAGALSGSISGSISGSRSNATTGPSSAASTATNQGNAQQQIINYNTPATQTIKNVPNIYAPGLAAAGSEVCLGSASAGGGAAGFGLTIGGTIVDRECQLRLNARTLATLGYVAAARETMCLDADVRQAMAAAGTPCAADRVVRRAHTAADARKGAASKEATAESTTSKTEVAGWPFGTSTR